MTNEERQILLKDLCMRLPYKVKVLDDMGRLYELHIGDSYIIDLFYGNGGYIEPPVKPYLRPLSSITPEERKEYHRLCDVEEGPFYERFFHDTIASIEYLTSKHFDYRGLIEKGLAIEASDDMYN